MGKRIITISREFGSGGRFIGKEVAKQLGIAYYDKNMKIVSCGMKLRISVGNSSDHEWGSSEIDI